LDAKELHLKEDLKEGYRILREGRVPIKQRRVEVAEKES